MNLGNKHSSESKMTLGNKQYKGSLIAGNKYTPQADPSILFLQASHGDGIHNSSNSKDVIREPMGLTKTATKPKSSNLEIRKKVHNKNKHVNYD